MPSIVKYLIIFVGSYIMIFFFYYITSVNPYLKKMREKDKKDDNKKGRKKKNKVSNEKKYGTDLQLLKAFYKIDLEKIGVLRTLKILNIVNPFVLSLLVVLVYPIKQIWLKLIVLMLIILPVVWFTYYFVAKYLRRIERKSNNV